MTRSGIGVGVDILNAAYEGVPRWDIGRPQPEFVKLAECGAIHGKVLDIGCGTGEATLYLARQGYDVTGIDISAVAIAKARGKAQTRGVAVTFVEADALELPDGIEGFDTVLDAGLFHVLTDEERAPYARSLHEVTRPGASLYILCFSDRQPGVWGPRRIREDEIRMSFADGWTIRSVDVVTMDCLIMTRFTGDDPTSAPRETAPVNAWLSSITRGSGV